MTGYARVGIVFSGLICAVGAIPAYGQTGAAVQPPVTEGADHSNAYYTFAMAHLYAELAGAYGNRGEYVNKAIDFYKQAMKLDPGSSYIGEELAEFYVQTTQLERATQLANDLIKANPKNANAHKILARIYARQIGDPEQGKIDQSMLKSALAEYQQIAEIDPKDTESLSMLARLYRVSKDDNSAEKTYRAILAVSPDDDDALTGLAAVYADRGDTANAIATLQQAAEKNPDVQKVTALAELYENDKQFSKAADEWKIALPLTNDNIQVRRHYAASLLEANRADEALKAFQDLATDDPKNVELQMQLLDLYRHKRDFANAHATLAKVQALSSGPEVKIAEAELLDSEGKTAQAITVLESVLSQTKKSQYNDAERGQRIQFLSTLSDWQKSTGKTQDSISSLRQISDLDPRTGPTVEAKVVDVYVAAKDFKAARQAADAALKKYPTDRAVVLEHASLLGDLGETDAALREFKAMPNADKDRDVQIMMSVVQEKGKRFGDELKTLDHAETLSTTDSEKQAIIFRRGAMFERQKSFDDAEREFRKLLQADPNNAEALNYLGYMFADRGVRLDEAQQMISKALDIEPGNGAFLDSLGWVHYRQNRLDQAAGELRQALDRIGNDDPTVHDHLGEVYFKQGKLREAIQQWEASVAGLKAAAPSDQDPEELAQVSHKLESAKTKIAEKQ
ncbi:MAG TPA: tetratricopeptide repeat protein [Bryobacteraceae bacterium]|nr:tetratricopeptide repeat protein [Bryobacteraceae bacterium]